jgi:hypothetical protein
MISIGSLLAQQQLKKRKRASARGKRGNPSGTGNQASLAAKARGRRDGVGDRKGGRRTQLGLGAATEMKKMGRRG